MNDYLDEKWIKTFLVAILATIWKWKWLNVNSEANNIYERFSEINWKWILLEWWNKNAYWRWTVEEIFKSRFIKEDWSFLQSEFENNLNNIFWTNS